MSEIIKTEAIVLSKINFGDTSRIAKFYTRDFGKISGIIKGARSPKSKVGSMIDTINYLQIIFYKKETRDVQLISEVDMIQYFPRIKDDYDKMKYASAIIELISDLTLENEHNKKLFDGTVKILSLIDGPNNSASFLFAKYFFFFLKELGYEFQYEHCNVCKKKINAEETSFNYETGLMCSNCREKRLTNFNFTVELLDLMICLNTKKSNTVYKEEDIITIINMLEKYLMYHVHEFKGIKSLKLHY